MWTRYQETRDQKVFETYKHIRNLVKAKSRTVAKQRQRAMVQSCKNNPKKFWQLVKSKTNLSTGIGDLKVNSGNGSKIINNDQEKAELFSDYFASIYTVEPSGEFEKLPQVLPVNSVPKLVVSEATVLMKLSQLKVNKSPGPDGIHSRILYEVRESISPYLTALFNSSLCQGVVPNEWKTSIVTAIHKKDRKDSVENYRPVSLTCITCKILESMVRDHIMDSLLSNNALSSMQYGFIRNRSVMLQLLKVVND